jgi:hypothetical protein
MKLFWVVIILTITIKYKNKYDYIKLKASANKSNNQQSKRQHTDWETIFAKHVSDKGLWNSNN